MSARKDLGEGTRYDLREITKRIQRKVTDEFELSVKEIEESFSMSRFDWYKKLKMKQSRFSIGDIGRIADALERRKPGSAPPGWPFVSEDEARAQLRRMLDNLVGTERRPQ